MKFGELVHKARIDNELTLSELSKLCGLTPAAICQIEQHRREPMLSTALTLMRALHIPVTRLLVVEQFKGKGEGV